MYSRTDSLTDWVGKHLGANTFSIEPASSDASFRQYFRVTENGTSYIVMDAPPDKEDSRPFVKIAGLFLNAGVNVPRVIEADLEQGYLLLSDLGNTQYLQSLVPDMADQLYLDAFQALHRIQTNVPVPDNDIPPYDDALLMREMELFREWFLIKYLNLEISAEIDEVIDTAFSFLSRSALEQPVVCVHRDYHSRNLMLTSGNNPGVLDFQDAVAGPITYDLVSLLRDCYIAWPRPQVEEWVKEYFRKYLGKNSGYEFDDKQFLEWFNLMGIQRHLKAIGIFSRLNIRDSKPGYLDDIPRTLNYILEVAPGYAELSGFHLLLRDKVRPELLRR